MMCLRVLLWLPLLQVRVGGVGLTPWPLVLAAAAVVLVALTPPSLPAMAAALP